MKQYEFKMDALMLSRIKAPVRNCYDAALLLLNALSYISWKEKCNSDAGDFKIIINKMNRMFFVQKEKIFSITIPFILREGKQGEIEIYDADVQINSKHLAVATEIFTTLNNSDLFQVVDFQNFLDDDFLTQEETTVIKRLVGRLLINEYGYLRYEEDSVHENGDIHPLFHLDINYSGAGTYKLGIENKVDFSWIRDCLDITTPCKFIKK